MQRLLLALALVCAAQAIAVSPAMKALDIQKLAGPWHSVAMASGSIAPLDSEAAAMRVFVKELRPVAKDALDITLAKWENGKCVEKKVLAQKTAAPAEFQSNDEDKTSFFVMDAKAESHMVVCMETAQAAQQNAQQTAQATQQNAQATQQTSQATQQSAQQTAQAAQQSAQAAQQTAQATQQTAQAAQQSTQAAQKKVTCQCLAKSQDAQAELATAAFSSCIKSLSAPAWIFFSPSQAAKSCSA